MLSASLLSIALFLGSTLADNDWSKPCLSGVCEYDLPASSGSASGTLKIWGSNTAISDITPAAGWEIVDCSPDALQQDIKLVCKEGASDCAHLYSGTANNNDAVGKVVRLPQNCGKSAFAVVTRAWTPQDQTIPAKLAASLTRRDGKTPTVQALHLDTSFSSVNPSSSGPINFAIQAANVPGAQGNLATSPQQQRRSNSRVFDRGLTHFVHGAIRKVSSLDAFNVTKSTTLTPVDIDKPFNLVDQSISCPPDSASVKVDVDAKAHAVATIGVAASGTVVPPKVSEFSIIAGLNANIDGSVTMQAAAAGTLDSGLVKLFEVGIGGIDFPGVLSIGPSFQINGQATANLDLNAAMTVGISYTVNNAQLTFPPQQSSTGSFIIGDTPLKLTAAPSATASGTVAAHLIPTLNFGISALDVVNANIFLALDASATMTLTGSGKADASDTINPRDDSEDGSADGVDDGADAPADAGDDSADASGDVSSDDGDDSSDEGADASSDSDDTSAMGDDDNDAANSDEPNNTSDNTSDANTGDSAPAIAPANMMAMTDASGSLQGCFAVDAALDVNAGADGDFFGLFNKNTKVDLFSKKFQLFQKCFGSPAARRSVPATVSRRSLLESRFFNRAARSSLERRAAGLVCPKAEDGAGGTQQTVADENIPAASITQVS